MGPAVRPLEKVAFLSSGSVTPKKKKGRGGFSFLRLTCEGKGFQGVKPGWMWMILSKVTSTCGENEGKTVYTVSKECTSNQHELRETLKLNDGSIKREKKEKIKKRWRRGPERAPFYPSSTQREDSSR